MVKQSYVPDRGHVVWLNFSPQSGHEQKGKRPALVLSPASYNAKVGLAICCPITRTSKKYPFEVGIPSGLKIEGVVLSDHVKSLDWKSRHASFVAKVPEKTYAEVLGKLKCLLEE